MRINGISLLLLASVGCSLQRVPVAKSSDMDDHAAHMSAADLRRSGKTRVRERVARHAGPAAERDLRARASRSQPASRRVGEVRGRRGDVRLT